MRDTSTSERSIDAAPPGLSVGTPPARPGSGLSVEPRQRVLLDRTLPTFTVTATTSAGLSSLSLAPARSAPASIACRSSDALDTAELVQRAEALLGALGTALTIAQDRRASETLDVVLTAQHEHMALVIQGMADQRRDYGEALERALQRFAQEMAPESILSVGETFRQSAGEITGALRRGEYMQGRVLEVLTGIRDTLKDLAQHGAALAAVAAKAEEPRLDKPASEKPALALVQPAKKAAPDSPLNHLDDDE
jgi:predicted RNA-binding Zn ribbon-like protein